LPLAKGESLIKSNEGDVSVRLPAGFPFKVQASISGKLPADFPREVIPRIGFGIIRTQFDLTKTTDSPHELVGAVGAAPTALLRIEADRGDVRIEKR
jgi:hypothetical protein